MFASKGIDILGRQWMAIYMKKMYITENGLDVDLFVHLSVICDKWSYNGKQLYSRFEHS